MFFCDATKFSSVALLEYGYAIDDVSITRQEYRLAKSKKLPSLVFIKGDASIQREQGTADFIKEIGKDPIRIVGLDRVRLDEYPSEALREALVNAVAHRDYEDGSRKIMLEVFSDRVVISSPGLPPPPITLQKLRAGKYRPCSRNPILAQRLSFFIASRNAAAVSDGCTTK